MKILDRRISCSGAVILFLFASGCAQLDQGAGNVEKQSPRNQRILLDLASKSLNICNMQKCDDSERDFWERMGRGFYEQYQAYAEEQPHNEDNDLFGTMLNNQPLLGGYRENAYGPGVHSDSTGRPFTWKADGDPSQFPNPLLEVKPNAYGLGLGSDQFGRPVRPSCPPGMVMC